MDLHGGIMDNMDESQYNTPHQQEEIIRAVLQKHKFNESPINTYDIDSEEEFDVIRSMN